MIIFYIIQLMIIATLLFVLGWTYCHTIIRETILILPLHSLMIYTGQHYYHSECWTAYKKAGPIRYYIIFVAPFQRSRSNRLLRRTNPRFWDNSQNYKQMSKTLATFRLFTNLVGDWLHSWIRVVNLAWTWVL